MTQLDSTQSWIKRPDCAGGITPRRITNVGYCVGGSVASLAAVFSALQCPTADVRCITFGSQLVGNAAFAESFRYGPIL